MSLISGLLAASAAKKQRKAQTAQNEKTETQAKEAAAKDSIRSDPGADLIFGAAKGSTATLRRGAKRGTAATSTATSGTFNALTGGRGALNRRAVMNRLF